MARLRSVPRPPSPPVIDSDASESDDDLPSLDTLIGAVKRTFGPPAREQTKVSRPPAPSTTLARRAASTPPPPENSTREVKWPSLDDLADALPECSSPPLPPLSRPANYPKSPNNLELSSSPPTVAPRRPLRRLVRGSERKPRSPSPSGSDSGSGDEAPKQQTSGPRRSTRPVIIDISSDDESNEAHPARSTTKPVKKNTNRRLAAPAPLPRNPYLCDSASESTGEDDEDDADTDLDGFIVSDNEEDAAIPYTKPFRKSPSQTAPAALPRKQYVWNGSSENESEEEDTDLSGFIVSDNEAVSIHDSSDELPTEPESSNDEEASLPRKLPPPPKTPKHDESAARIKQDEPSNSGKLSSIWDIQSSSPASAPPPSRTPAKIKGKGPGTSSNGPPLRNIVNIPVTPRVLNNILYSSSPESLNNEHNSFSSSPPTLKSTTMPPKTPKRSPTKAPLTNEKVLAKTLREFKQNRERLADEFLVELDNRVCDGALSRLYEPTGGMRIEWSKTMRTTAGRARHRTITSGRGKGTVEGIIELGEKMIDRPDRLYNTLAHEFCHLTTMGLDGEFKNHHGAIFKSWGRKTEAAFPEYDIVVSTTHSYSAEMKYNWTCQQCGYVYQRHSKSIDPLKVKCGPCRGTLVQTKPKPREMGAYARFVKENMASVKKMNPGTPHKELMKLVGQQWAEKKAAESPVKKSEGTGMNRILELGAIEPLTEDEDEVDKVGDALGAMMDKLKV